MSFWFWFPIVEIQNSSIVNQPCSCWSFALSFKTIQKFQFSSKVPVQKVLNNLSRQVWLLVLKRAYSGDKIQPKIASYISWYFGFFHLLRPVNLSDIFEDDGPFSQQLSESPLLAQQSSLHKVSTVNTAFKTQSFGQVLVAFGPLQAKLGLVIFLKNCRLTQNCLKNGCWSLVLIRDASK